MNVANQLVTITITAAGNTKTLQVPTNTALKVVLDQNGFPEGALIVNGSGQKVDPNAVVEADGKYRAVPQMGEKGILLA